MRIVLDLQDAQGKHRYQEAGRFTLGLAESLARHRGQHEVILALSDLFPDTIEPIRGRFNGLLDQDCIRVWKAVGPIRAADRANEWRRRAAARLRASFISSLEPDIVHVSGIHGGYGDDVVAGVEAFGSDAVTTVSLYDDFFVNPNRRTSPGGRHERHLREARSLMTRADGWLAVSVSAALNGSKDLGLDSACVTHVPSAPDPRFRQVAVTRELEAQFRARHRVPGRFVMTSGSPGAQETLAGVVEAYAYVPSKLRDGRQLVVLGPMAASAARDLQATARAAGLRPDDVRITGEVDVDDLVLLYNLCELLVLPSGLDRSGLLAQEAMASGTAVIATNQDRIERAQERSEAPVEAPDRVTIGAEITRVLSDPALHSELVHQGSEHTRMLSGAASAKFAIAAFERLHESRVRNLAPRGSGVDIEVAQLTRELGSLPGHPEDQDLLRVARDLCLNHAASSRARLLVDVSVIVQVDAGSGIQRVVRNILRWLPKLLDGRYDVEPIYATVECIGYRHVNQSDRTNQPLGLMPADAVVEPRPGDVFLGLDLAQDVVAAQSQFYAELRRAGIPVYFVVYDLLPVLMPHKFSPDHDTSHRQWLQVVGDADGAICISRSVANELRAWVESNGSPRHRPLRIEWFHPGVDIDGLDAGGGVPIAAPEVLDRLAARPTFLLVGTIEPRKGHMQTLDAFERLWAAGTDVNLVFVGGPGWRMDQFTVRLRLHPELGSRLFWLEHITDEYLDEIYRASTCLLVPSEGEGFGLPLIEAARHGTPIIARDIEVFREVAGAHAFYFVGLTPMSLAEAVSTWLTLYAGESHPRPDGINAPTWQQSTTRVVEILVGTRDIDGLAPDVDARMNREVASA